MASLLVKIDSTDDDDNKNLAVDSQVEKGKNRVL